MSAGNTFRSPDLYEKRVSYPRAIVNNIHALARIAKDLKGYSGPTLEVEIAAGSGSSVLAVQRVRGAVCSRGRASPQQRALGAACSRGSILGVPRARGVVCSPRTVLSE